MSPVFFTVPDGYIRLTKDSGTLYGDYALKSITYTLDSGGFDHVLVIGDTRPDISTIRLKVDENKSQSTVTPDTTPPTIRAIDSWPLADTKKYQQVDANFYLGAYAEDDVGVTDVDFYLAKWTAGSPGSYGSWISLGAGALQAAPDSESQPFWRLAANAGFIDLTAAPANLDPDADPGEIFKIKRVATDAAGNKGEVVNEYQLGLEGFVVTDEIDLGDSPALYDTPDRREMIAGTTFNWVFTFPDRSVGQQPTITYGADSITGGFSISAGQYTWTSNDITVPAKGKTKRLSATITDRFGNVYLKYKYIKGIERPAMGVTPKIIDTTAAIDDEDVSYPQFINTGNIRFEAYFKDPDYLVLNTAGDPNAEFRIYNQGSTTPDVTIAAATTLLMKEATSNVSDGNTPGTGRFYWTGTVAALQSAGATGDGVKFVTFRMKRTEDFIDENGDEQTDAALGFEEGAKVGFEIVPKTVRTRVEDEKTKVDTNITDITTINSAPNLPQALAGAKVDYDDGGGATVAEIRHYGGTAADPTDPAPDAGGKGWFGTSDDGSTWVRFADNPGGTASDTYEINNDDSSETVVDLIMTANSGANKGAIRYDYNGGSPFIKSSLNYESGTPTWSDITTGVSTAIENDFSGTTYRLEMDGVTEELTFWEDPDGTPDAKFILKTDGTIEAYNDYTFISDETLDFGEESFKANRTFTKDINTSASDWSLTWDGSNNITFPDNIAIGFQDG
jgi:hypothetical protein